MCGSTLNCGGRSLVSQSNRNLTLDNAKVILIFTVIFGHLIEPFVKDHTSIKTLYIWLYSFHMPAFILISGMLSHEKFSHRHLLKLIKAILIPFIIFNLFYELAHFVTAKETSRYFQNIIPYWVMWYLLSLFIWRSTLPIIKKVPFYLPLSIIPALLIGLITDVHELFGLSRTFYFWPIFLLGHKLTPEFTNSKAFKKTPVFLCILFLITIYFIFGELQNLNYKIFYGDLSYSKLKYEPLFGIVSRLSFIVLSVMASLAVIRLTPQTTYIPAKLKQNTLYAYLWHGFLIKALIAAGITTTLTNWPVLGLISFLIIAALIITYALSAKIIAEATSRFILAPIRNIL